jgi:hypothetical protein
MTLTQLKEDSKFLRLTEAQKNFVLKFCETEDKVAAAHLAWRCKSDASAIAMANKALRQKEISVLVSEFVEIVEDKVSKDEMLAVLGRRFRASSDDELILKFAERISKLEGWDVKPSAPTVNPTDPSPPSVFDEVARLEK